VYGGAMAVTGLVLSSVWRYASGGRRLIADDVDPPLVRYILHRSVVVPLAFAPSLAVALVSPRGAELLWLLAFSVVALARCVHHGGD
jgi:hypothetical protein